MYCKYIKHTLDNQMQTHTLMISIFYICLLHIAYLSTISTTPTSNLTVVQTFQTCCRNGILLDKNLDKQRLQNNHSECSIIAKVTNLLKQIKSVSSPLDGNATLKCSLIRDGCYLAKRTKSFCLNANENDMDVDQSLFDKAKGCCFLHDKLPSTSVWPDGNIPINEKGTPVCCFEDKSYQTWPDIADLSNFNNNKTNLTSPTETEHSTPQENEEDNYEDMDIFGSIYFDEVNETMTTPITSSSVTSNTNNVTDLIYTNPVIDLPNKLNAPRSVVCEKGFIWYPEKRLCIHMQMKCPKGMYLSLKQNACLARIQHPDKSCAPGHEYREDDDACVDVNECSEGVLKDGIYSEACPGTSQQCTNLIGTYECQCQKGFHMVADGDCVDIDECVMNRQACKTGYKCINIIGSFQCLRQVPCGFGYVLNAETQKCEDIDECKVQPDICGKDMLCINVRGGLKCVNVKCPGKQRRNSQGKCTPCPSGYLFNNATTFCEDIDECKLNKTICREHEKCTNRPGDYICEPKIRCEWGMRLNNQGTMCEDVNECKTKAFHCSISEICVNTPGSYYCVDSPCHFTEIYNYETERCECDIGYAYKGRKCQDIDECTTNPEICPTGKTCLNIPGDYKCVTLNDCPAGFKRNSIRESCIDINECALGTAKCSVNMHCENTVGSYRCLCERGFKNVNETFCVDINECSVFNPNESCPDKRARCVNTPGSYKCICPKGFIWHGYPTHACKDINECAMGIDKCGVEHNCVNEEGSYRCECSTGYRNGYEKTECIDINECAESPVNLCTGGICVNTPGAFRCDCPIGYRLGTNNQCIDVDECKENENICNLRKSSAVSYRCVNIHGGYRCASEQCPSMYTKKEIKNGYRCALEPAFSCSPDDIQCMQDRPIQNDFIHIEVMSPLKGHIILGEVDSTIVSNGTINVELLEHYAHHLRTNAQLSVKHALKLRLKPSNYQIIELLLIRKLEAPSDVLVSVRLTVVHGQLRAIRSTSKFYLYITESTENQTRFQQKQLQHTRYRG